MEIAQTARKARKSAPTGNKKISVWHNRLVHVNEPLLKMLHGHVNDFSQLEGKLPFFHPSQLGKATRKTFKNHFKAVSYPGEVVKSDLCGPMPTSMDGAKCASTFMDHCKRYKHVARLSRKIDTFVASEQCKELAHTRKYFPKGVGIFHTESV